MTPWLTPELAVGPSPVDGLGLFATEAIDAGEPCCRIGGRVLDDAAFRGHVATVASYSASQLDEDVHVLQEDDPARFRNHSCDPNLWLGDAVTVVARRPIAPGEEATIDDALLSGDPSWSMPCRRGSPTCRGRVTGDDWRRPDLRARDGERFSPFLLRRPMVER